MQRVPHLLGRALRETGQALDRVGLTISGVETFRDTVTRHRPIMNLFDKVRHHFSCFLVTLVCSFGEVSLVMINRNLVANFVFSIEN